MEYVPSRGGTSRINGTNQDIREPTGLPQDAYQLTSGELGNNPQVTDAGLAHLKDKTLRFLKLAGTPVTDGGLTYIKDCQNLSVLNLDNTQVIDAGLTHLEDKKLLTLKLEGLTNLTELKLRGTKVTAPGLAALQQPRGQKIFVGAADAQLLAYPPAGCNSPAGRRFCR